MCSTQPQGDQSPSDSLFAADVLRVGRADAADTNADAIDAMESKIINMANLVDKLGIGGGVGAVEKQSMAAGKPPKSNSTDP